ncbi:hypothetical protein [Streptomyces omiyaensis]|uniref:hypothetical protein n=1 Tax=Streptomyces omiyaensis TaxID=68247 RepID=UPI0016720B0C|nr:hypothetical protein [Streptomyces omiyaensis]
MAAFAMSGAAEGPQLTAVFAVRHEQTPRALRGRVFAAGAGLRITGFAAGATAAGPVASRSVAAVVCALSALPCAGRAARPGGHTTPGARAGSGAR